MNLHLAEISHCVGAGAHAVVVLNGAGRHQPGDKLKLPRSPSLLSPPPYRPEPDPQENVWQYFRQNYLSNCIFDSYDDMLDACCDAWNKRIAQTRRITSMATL